tara:strand:+ start:1922 stop:2173 length:252 start_codon:yes stop_codon:yes gene_type:complete
MKSKNKMKKDKSSLWIELSSVQVTEIKKYMLETDKKIKQLTKIVRENLKIKNPTVLEQHELDETLDRLHKYHGRKNMLQEYVL